MSRAGLDVRVRSRAMYRGNCKEQDRHRHKGSSKSGKGGSSRDGKHKGAGRDDFGQHRLEGEDGGEETPEYEGRVDDPKEFAPTTKKVKARRCIVVGP